MTDTPKYHPHALLVIVFVAGVLLFCAIIRVANPVPAAVQLVEGEFGRAGDLKCAVCGEAVSGRTYTEENGVKIHFCGLQHGMESLGDQPGTVYLGTGHSVERLP